MNRNKFKNKLLLEIEDITSKKDIINCRKCMADNYNYPLSLTDCEVIGLNGNCGKKCPIYLSGKCNN